MQKPLKFLTQRSLSVLILICLISAISCTKPNFNPEKIFKEHNRAELDYFIDVGFKRFGSSIYKQTENFEVSIIGTPQKSDIMLIDTIIAELKPLIFPINIKRVEKGGKLLIYLTPDYKGTIPKNVSGQCYDMLKIIFGTNLFSTSIWISPEISGMSREKVFRHEFCHALGFKHPELFNNNGEHPKLSNNNYYKSVMQTKSHYFFNNNSKEIEGTNIHFSEIDKAVIRILYDKDIPNGLSKKSFVNLYEKFKKNDVYQQGNLILNP